MIGLFFIERFAKNSVIFELVCSSTFTSSVDKRFNSDNLDLFFKDNFGSMYNNIVFVDENTQINADQVNMNLLNGDINIKMFQEEKKIKILKK